MIFVPNSYKCWENVRKHSGIVPHIFASMYFPPIFQRQAAPLALSPLPWTTLHQRGPGGFPYTGAGPPWAAGAPLRGREGPPSTQKEAARQAKESKRAAIQRSVGPSGGQVRPGSLSSALTSGPVCLACSEHHILLWITVQPPSWLMTCPAQQIFCLHRPCGCPFWGYLLQIY